MKNTGNLLDLLEIINCEKKRKFLRGQQNKAQKKLTDFFEFIFKKVSDE